MINLRKLFYISRTKGIKGLKKYFELNVFEKKLLGNKTVEWCDDGYWKMDPMPSQRDLDKFYQDVYWFSNSDYKSHILLRRDLKHSEFIKQEAAIELLHPDGKIIVEVPNTRIKNPDSEYFEGGCNGKTSGSHTLYFTKDFFENLGAKISFYGGDYNQADYPKVSFEDNANFIRAVINFKGLKNYLSSKNLINQKD